VTEDGLSPKLNILALPNQTAVVFWLIVTVILGVFIGGSFTTTIIPFWPFGLAMLILPLRAFLGRPEREIAAQDLIPLQREDLLILKTEVTQLCNEIGLKKPPKLMISRNNYGVGTLGTFRHHYIALNEMHAEKLARDLNDPERARQARALLSHELYHFQNRDHLYIGYVGELLRTNFALMTWGLLFFLGFGLLLISAANEFLNLDIDQVISRLDMLPDLQSFMVQSLPSTAQIAELREKASSIDMGLVLGSAVSVIWPFIIIGFTILWVYWPKLWRTREFYADAGMVRFPGSLVIALSVITGIPPVYLASTPSLPNLGFSPHRARGPFSHFRSWFRAVSRRFVQIRQQKTVPDILRKCRRLISELPSIYHPGTSTRAECILHPELVFDSWQGTALLVGSLVILLDFLAMTPLTFHQMGRWPMHFHILASVILISLNYIIPAVAQGRNVAWGLLRIVGVVGGIRLVLILAILTLLAGMLFLAPTQLDNVLCYAVGVTAGVKQYSDNLCFSDPAAYVSAAASKNLMQVLLTPLLTGGALAVISFLLRRVFTWYSIPKPQDRILRLSYVIVIAVTSVWGVGLLPIATTALLKPGGIFSPVQIGLVLFSLFVLAAGLLSFYLLDRRYALRCPKCGQIHPGKFVLGRKCCDEYLHPWLVVEYEYEEA
jgi:hypothetical protein